MRAKRSLLRGLLLMVLCAGLVPVLATGSASAAKPGLTRGFDIYNWTGQALTVSRLEIKGDMPQFDGPALQQGSVLPPGGKVHVELFRSIGLLDNRELTVRYTPVSESPSSSYRFFQMTLESSSGNAECFAPRYSGGSQQCQVAGNSIKMLDIPGTGHNLDPAKGDGPQAASVLATLCRPGSGATCDFKPDQGTNGMPDVHARENPVVASWGAQTNCPNEEHDFEEKYFLVEYTSRSQNSLEAGFRYAYDGNFLREQAARKVRAAYGHGWTNELRLPAEGPRQVISARVPKGETGYVVATFPVIRYTGNYIVTMGDTSWSIDHVTWDVPDPSRLGDEAAIWHVVTRPATQDELYACDSDLDPVDSVHRSPVRALTISKDGNERSNVLQGGPESDVLLGRGGNDILVGGGGSNRLVGGAGNDALFANSVNGTDILNGGPGADTMIAHGRAVIRTGRRTGRGWDYVYVRDGRADDTVYCQSRKTIVYADKGDRIRGRCGKVIRRGPKNQPRPLL